MKQLLGCPQIITITMKIGDGKFAVVSLSEIKELEVSDIGKTVYFILIRFLPSRSSKALLNNGCRSSIIRTFILKLDQRQC